MDFQLNLEDLSHGLNTFQDVRIEMNNAMEKAKVALQNLYDMGWEGESKIAFESQANYCFGMTEYMLESLDASISGLKANTITTNELLNEGKNLMIG